MKDSMTFCVSQRLPHSKDPLVPFDATLVPQSLAGPVVTASPEPQVEPDVVESVPTEMVEHPQAPDPSGISS